MGSGRLYSAALFVAGALCVHADVPFITELGIFSQLAPCVTDAVSNAYLWEQDSTACGSEPTKLQSCICTNSNELKKMTVSIVSAVSSRCGNDASEDQASASSLIDKYCHPEKTITFSTPTTNIIPGVMSDVAAISSLPACVQSGLSAAANAAYDGCPTVANMWAPCVCSKKIIVDEINSSLGAAVRQSCSNGDDVTLASSFYTQFCAMNQGTTSFGPLPGPPGDMSYYITALPQYKSLRPCAQSGVIEAVMQQSSFLCASGPQALASCVCLKAGVLGKASSSLTDSVKYYCSNTALADVSSAADVLDYYCQAAQKKVVATVSESISQTKATTIGASTGGSSSGSGAPKKTGAAGDGGSNDSKSGGDGGLGRGAIIAIAVLGALVIIAAIAFIAICVRRRNRRSKAAAAAENDTIPLTPSIEHPELASNSPASEIDGKSGYAAPTVSEVAASPHPHHLQPHAELPAGQHTQMQQATSPSDLSSPGYQQSHSVGTPSPYTPQSDWQHGEQPRYELDSSPYTHAR